MPRAKIESTMCPDCFMTEGVDEPLIVRTGTMTRCARGHTWAEMEDLDHRIDLAKRKRDAMEPEAESKPLDPDATPKPFAAPKGGEMMISETDHIRLSSILGDFNDSATLFGSVMSLQMDLKNTQEILTNLQAQALARANQQQTATENADPSGPIPAGGDMTIRLVIPEQHIQALQDISEAQGTTLETYVNAIVSEGLNSSWFF